MGGDEVRWHRHVKSYRALDVTAITLSIITTEMGSQWGILIRGIASENLTLSGLASYVLMHIILL